MRAAAILVVLVAAAAAAAPRPTALGFDHHVHDRDLVVGGGDALPCTRCHTLDAGGRLVGKPAHGSCFGACHGAPPRTPAPGKPALDEPRAKICEACHAEGQLVAPFTGKLPAAYPPYTIDQDFNLGFGHKQHAAAPCTECHTPDAKPRTAAAHDRCTRCHQKTMSTCGGCHPPATGKPQPPELAALHDTVAATFSHKAHAARGKLGAECTTCHAAIRATDDSELPRPTIKDCGIAGCHDGKAAFATVAACVRCHDKPPERFAVARPTARFEHGGPHAAALAATPCGACHPIVRGEVAVANHAACATCHADDFGARQPKICGACHDATEPWRHLVADRAPPERTEFGARLDHAKHAGDCRTCHALDTLATQLRPPRGHAACAAAGCHAAGNGPAPHLDACDGCHQLGLAAARLATRAKDPWSVRAVFDHRAHPRDLACAACHTSLAGADVAALPAPAKPTCAPCHDGKAAFSLTGTSCTKCHRGLQP